MTGGERTRQGSGDDSGVRELEARFAVIEQRIRDLLDRNRMLRDRVNELEQELNNARSASQDKEQWNGTKLRIRERIEGILRTLEAAGPAKGGQDQE